MLKRAKPTCLITFHTTADAMSLEKLCREANIPGRLIPVPRRVTSDCGIAWASEGGLRRELEELIAGQGLEIAGVYELEL